MAPATYEEIRAYLAGIAAASPAWAEALYSARLSLEAVERYVVTMASDASSPLREAEEGILSKEIVRMNAERGVPSDGDRGNGRLPVRLRAVLSPSEQTRVSMIVSGFCQPIFVAGKKFGRNGHTVMNAARRATTAYMYSRIPRGAAVIEVGPEIIGWMTGGIPDDWVKKEGVYVAARPVLTPRDSVRVDWKSFAKLVLENRAGLWSEEVRDKAGLLVKSYGDVFRQKKIQDIGKRGEYILSTDANYDIAFDDMPVVMMATGARAWYGVMSRAKGLTKKTRVNEGSLDLMGAVYRVDWKAGRIDFKHPQCSAFGYSHDVWEYMKYEEHNGYIWSSEQADYVYSKGPETTDELLFFHVVRVPKLLGVIEPRFVEAPLAGMMEIKSVWAIGDEISGVPTAFAPVVFHVDALNFSKVLEKRRGLDCRGNLTNTVVLVRSTNVRMWINGTPVGANKRIEAKLAEATAVAIEVLAMQGRLGTNMAFSGAMEAFSLEMRKGGFWYRMLETIFDMRMTIGKVSGPITRAWQTMRSALVDVALSPLTELSVHVRVVAPHVALDDNEGFVRVKGADPGSDSQCRCMELADLRNALPMVVGATRIDLMKVIAKLEKRTCDICCNRIAEKMNAYVDVDLDTSSEEEECFSLAGDSNSVEDSVSEYSEMDEPYWRNEGNALRPELRAMEEFVNLETYLMKAELTELRVDASRIMEFGPYTSERVKEFCTGRTEHALLKFQSGRCIASLGADVGEVSAIYNLRDDRVIPVRKKGQVLFSTVKDGYYYTCNRLKVWNAPELVAAVNYALDYGAVSAQRCRYEVTMGVPGAGKTRGMMKVLANGPVTSNFIVLAVTKASVAAAQKYGVEFGISEKVLKARVMTLDSYLMHCKCPADLVCVDEFPMVHIGKVDAAVSISGASVVRLCGDAQQIPYDPFNATFQMKYSRLGDSVNVQKVKFLGETHRLTRDVCAMWLDQYPYIYPCECCRVGLKERPSMEVVHIASLDAVDYDDGVRYHTYKQEEKEQLIQAKGLRSSAVELRARSRGGVATVHQDQGSTHVRVHTVRCSTVYDKNASVVNPSLYNRERYVLTDTTRHTEEYKYLTMCDEQDMVIKRIAMSRDVERLSLVARKEGFGKVSVMDML